ncbi:MAG: FMN-binding protein [candidate division WOR-3 bacterium]|nr:FMN-binding protein [candidate division WOR-3 bacterium]
MSDRLKHHIIFITFLTISILAVTISNFYFSPLIARTALNGELSIFKSLIDADEFMSLIPDTLWQALDSARAHKGYILKVWPEGYIGKIPITVGIDKNNKITGVYIAGADEGFKETPGLGSMVRERKFLNQFKGKEITRISLKKDGGEIDAISGATISSRAVCEGIKKGFEKYSKFFEQGQKSDVKKDIFPNADNFSEIVKDTLWYALSNSETLGIVFSGWTIGYLDTIKYLAGLNRQKNIEKVIITYSKETEGIGERIREEEFLNKFRTGVPDVISGATISSEALIKSIKQSTERFKSYLK